MRSIRFGVLAITLCGLLTLAAGLHVISWQRELAAIDAEQELLTGQLLDLRNALDALLDIETGQRGFQLTGEESYLEPYLAGTQILELALGRLILKALADPVFFAGVDRIIDLAGDKKRVSSQIIELRRAGAADRALEIVKGGEGKRLMDAFRQHANALQDRLLQASADLKAQEARRHWQVLVLGAVLVALILALVACSVVWLTTTIRRIERLQRQREQEAMHDALTGLPNRRYLREWLEVALASSGRTERPLVLLYFDLDGFKAVNDRLGHEAGDRVLQAAASRLRATLRTSDFVARLGGDEFVAILPDAPEPARLRSIIERLAHELSTSLIPELDNGAVSASIGVANYPGDGKDPDTLLNAGDRAMYLVKESRAKAPRSVDMSGRNNFAYESAAA